MNEEIRNAAERFADEHQQEQRELLYALGQLPAPTRQEWVDLSSLPTGLKIAVALMAQSCLDA